MMISGFSSVKNGQWSYKKEANPKSQVPEDVLNILKERSNGYPYHKLSICRKHLLWKYFLNPSFSKMLFSLST